MQAHYKAILRSEDSTVTARRPSTHVTLTVCPDFFEGRRFISFVFFGGLESRNYIVLTTFHSIPTNCARNGPHRHSNRLENAQLCAIWCLIRLLILRCCDKRVDKSKIALFTWRREGSATWRAKQLAKKAPHRQRLL